MRNLWALSLLVACSLAACSGPRTRITSTWRDPAVSQLNFSKIAVLAAADKADLRREAEDQLVRLISRAAPTYPFMPAGQLKSSAAVRTALQAAGYDGLIVMRLVELREDVSYIPASPNKEIGWESFDWDEMGVANKQTTAVLETRIYSVPENRALWVSRSETLEPGSVRRLLPSVVAATRAGLKKDGLLP